LKSVAVVGLGSGSLACHRREGEDWTFFEIDPEVVRLARDPAMFRFLSACAPAAPVVLGDARLTLAGSSRQFDLIVLDAFSSDAIPAHLLTREALRGYLARLSPRGTILMHISNRHMELAKVVAAIGATEGLVTFVKTDEKASQFVTELYAAALVAVLARNEADLGALPATEGWRATEAGTVVPWTDDYSDIIGAIVRKKLGR
jgi:spermidine synthase